MNKIDYDVALEIASHEAIVRQAYKDSVGVWTWSVGLTSATGHNVERYIGKPQTLEHCLKIFVWALERYAIDVREAFKGQELTKSQFAAALSFHWNTGGIKKASWVKSFLAGDIKGARKSFMSWNKPKEIIPRRTKDRDLFFDGKWSNTGTMTEYTKVKSNGTPDWSSAKKINIKSELSLALSGAGVAPESPSLSNSVDKPETVSHSKRFWTWLTAGLFPAVGLLDWRVQLLSVTIVGALAVYAIYSMPAVKSKLAELVGRL